MTREVLLFFSVWSSGSSLLLLLLSGPTNHLCCTICHHPEPHDTDIRRRGGEQPNEDPSCTNFQFAELLVYVFYLLLALTSLHLQFPAESTEHAQEAPASSNLIKCVSDY
ncbi:hypothetical protein LEMLEM_LOCUS13980 [Lemmus lemmus]